MNGHDTHVRGQSAILDRYRKIGAHQSEEELRIPKQPRRSLSQDGRINGTGKVTPGKRAQFRILII
jgi:hypothetical protein